MNRDEVLKEVEELIKFKLGITYQSPLTDEQRQERNRRYGELFLYIKENLK